MKMLPEVEITLREGPEDHLRRILKHEQESVKKKKSGMGHPGKRNSLTPRVCCVGKKKRCSLNLEN